MNAAKTRKPRDFARSHRDTPAHCANVRKHMGPSARNYGHDCDCPDRHEELDGFITGDRISCENCSGYIDVP